MCLSDFWVFKKYKVGQLMNERNKSSDGKNQEVSYIQ